MAISKIILNGVTQMDVTQDTVASANLLSGETATGADGQQVVGAYVPASAPTIESLSVTSNKTQQTYNSSSVDGYKPVTVGAISSSYVGSGITRRSSSDMTSSGATVTAPAGYYESASSKTVASGTEGTPTATKGTVSNHAVTVTPSVTNSAGYISGGTKNGTGVSVSASELVSGTYTVDSSGTKDVTNYASASVPAGTAGTPTATKGTVSNHSVTVTPSVTNQTGFITGSTINGTGVSVSASELVSGSQTITENGTVDVTNLAEVVISVEGGGGGSTGVQVGTKSTTPSSASASISFTGLDSEPTSFVVVSRGDLATGAAPYKTASVVFDGENVIGQYITNTNNAQVTYDASGFSKSYSNGTLTVTGTNSNFQTVQYDLVYSYGESPSLCAISSIVPGEYVKTDGSFEAYSGWSRSSYIDIEGLSYLTICMPRSGRTLGFYDASHDVTGTQLNLPAGVSYVTVPANTKYFVISEDDTNILLIAYVPAGGGGTSNIGTKDVQVGSGATSITFTDLEDEPSYFSCAFKSNFGISSGYQRIITVVYDGTDIYGLEMDSGAKASDIHWSYTYNNGSLVISSQGTNAGGYFHQPGYYQLTYVTGGDSGGGGEIEVEPLSVTQNGTYTAPTGKAYSPVTVTVSGGGANIATATMTNSSNQNTSISFTIPSGRTVKACFCRLTSQIARNSNSRYYYVFDMRRDGSSSGGVEGNQFYMYNGTLSNVTSGYSYAQSGTTVTLSSTGSRSAAPGSFYNGTYELTYVY